MMMPANFTAVNSEVVYGGADLFSILADTTAPIWGTANVKTFNTNLLTILSNTFTKYTVAATMGTMFSGNWGGDNGVKLFGDEGSVNKLFTNQFKTTGAGTEADPYVTTLDGAEMNFGNKVMRTLGVAASVYTLGTTPVKNYISENVVGING
jgi:hypothetical protein